jgi:hypothetical protein
MQRIYQQAQLQDLGGKRSWQRNGILFHIAKNRLIFIVKKKAFNRN